MGPALAQLQRYLDYDPLTGVLTWKPRVPCDFNETARGKEWACAVWNTKFAGREAFTHINHKGYKIGAVLAQRILAHRAAMALLERVEPHSFDQIDHINGIKTDNSAKNLRIVDGSENGKNLPLYKTNKSGVPGVMWEQSHKAWAVKINIAGKQRRIGRFKIFEEAVRVRHEAEVRYGYHQNHGRIAA